MKNKNCDFERIYRIVTNPKNGFNYEQDTLNTWDNTIDNNYSIDLWNIEGTQSISLYFNLKGEFTKLIIND